MLEQTTDYIIFIAQINVKFFFNTSNLTPHTENELGLYRDRLSSVKGIRGRSILRYWAKCSPLSDDVYGGYF